MSNKNNVITVLNRMMKMVNDDEDYTTAFSDFLDEMLNSLQYEDAFGTEGQCDPRGDFREGSWDMWNVEGVNDETINRNA